MSSIQLSETLSLRIISFVDALQLKQLMHRIYPPPYKHLWKDDGQWYVQQTFNEAALEKELSETNAAYYFVAYQSETIGVLRFIHDVPLSDVPGSKATKLHRIYLDPKLHGKGIGASLMDWVKKQAIENGAQILWLEAMDTQQQALQFYKNLGYEISSDFRLSFKLMYEDLRGMHRMYELL